MNNKALVLDLMEWVAREPRSYADFIAAWHTSCPRLTIWEDAQDLGLVERVYRPGLGTIVSLTETGRAFLCSERQPAFAGPD
jgi:hypothetical protein